MPIDIDAIRKREQAATPGPWNVGPSGDDDFDWTVDRWDGFNTTELASLGGEAADAEFIAGARTDVTDLLAEVDRLSAELDRHCALSSAVGEWYSLDPDKPGLSTPIDADRALVDAYQTFTAGGAA